MNVLRAFDKAVMKQKMKNEFITEYIEFVKDEDIYGTVQFHSGDKFFFRCIRSMEDAHLISGVRFSAIEYYGSFNSHVMQYLNSRVRSANLDNSGE